jgi:NAD-reducing hydrogenase small subunit
MRNTIPVEELLRKGYVESASTVDGVVPAGQEVPALLPKALAVNEVVPVEVYVPGCPPSPEAIAYALKEILQGKVPRLPTGVVHFD